MWPSSYAARPAPGFARYQRRSTTTRRVVGFELARERLDGDERRSIGIHRRRRYRAGRRRAPVAGRGTRAVEPARRSHVSRPCQPHNERTTTRRTTVAVLALTLASDPRPGRLRRGRRAAARGQGVRGGEGDGRWPGPAAGSRDEAPPELLGDRHRCVRRLQPHGRDLPDRWRAPRRRRPGDHRHGLRPGPDGPGSVAEPAPRRRPGHPPRRERPGPRGRVREHHLRRSRGRRAGRASSSARPGRSSRSSPATPSPASPPSPSRRSSSRTDGTLEVNAGCNRGSGTWTPVARRDRGRAADAHEDGLPEGSAPTSSPRSSASSRPARSLPQIDSSLMTLQAGNQGLMLRAS